MNNQTQEISQKRNSTNHIHTYIHTYMEKRTKNTTTTNTNVIFYDGKYLEELKEIAFRNKTNVSSIISNLSREFVLLFKSETPQKTLFNFDEEQKLYFKTHIKEAENYLRSLSDKDYKEWAFDLEMWMNLERKVTNSR